MDFDYKPVEDNIDLDELYELMKPYDTRPRQPQPAQEVREVKPAEVRRARSAGARRKAAKKEEEEKGDPLYECYGILHDIAYVLMIVTLLFVFVVRLVGVDGKSMLPTLHHGDYLILESNFLYGDDDIEAGDIVVLTVPYYKEEPIVKRVIATEGQTVDIDFATGSVYVNGELLEEDYINELTFVDEGTEFPLTVPEGAIFVMGDNRNHSDDSRNSRLGTVDTRYVIGKAVFLLFPGPDSQSGERDFSRIGFFG